jgi:hypothetical protein
VSVSVPYTLLGLLRQCRDGGISGFLLHRVYQMMHSTGVVVSVSVPYTLLGLLRQCRDGGTGGSLLHHADQNVAQYRSASFGTS